MSAAPVTDLDTYRLQDGYFRLLRDVPEMRQTIEEIVAWETNHPPESQWDGWSWQDVHTGIATINRLIASRLVDMVRQSRASSSYRLSSLAAASEALASLDVETPRVSSVDVDAMFNIVIGHERVKAGLRYAIKADGPVHCLIQSPPGMAKTLILGEIGALPGACFYVGSTTSKAGLVGLLLSERPRYMVIDELDKMALVDMSPLLNLMETGMVTRLIHGSNERISLETKVFAGANDISHIDPAILSRFAKFSIPPYTAKEFVDVAQAVLMTVHGQGREMAMLIANTVVQYSTDIRDAVRVARMARKNPMAVRDIAACLFGTANGPVRPRVLTQ